jgi:hypothetical protein
MKYLRKFLMFKETVAEKDPKIAPDKTKVKPATRPSRPSPFPTKRPGEHDLPDPMAKATEDEVVSKFKELADDEKLKKYFPEA